jgi:hypothetical protein
MMVWRADVRVFASIIESTLQNKVHRLDYHPMKAPTFITGFLRRLVLTSIQREAIDDLSRQGGPGPVASRAVELPCSGPNSVAADPIAFVGADFFD